MNKTLSTLFASCLLLSSLSTPALAAQRYPIPAESQGLVGKNLITRSSDSETLIDISERFKMGYNLLKSANPSVDAWMPGAGTPVTLPMQTLLPDAPREGIVVNIPEMRLYHFQKGTRLMPASVTVYPISVGRGEWSTPLTTSKVVGRAENPTWYPPETIRQEHADRGDPLPRVVPPGPDNPLGEYILVLDIPSYFIHGTNKKFGIGMQVTHGCIRMYPKDIRDLTLQTPNNTPVLFVNQRVKVGWHNGELYLEAHRALEMEESNGYSPVNSAVKAIVAATEGRKDIEIDWDKVNQVVETATGLPEVVSQSGESSVSMAERTRGES